MKRLILLGALAAIPFAASAQVLFSDDFDSNSTANWQINASNTGNVANVFFDYSTVGIPSAPGSSGGSTFGMKLESNIPGTGVFSGVSASPLGQSFSGDYKLSFYMWQNFNGPFPGGGSGSTQMSMGGIGAPTAQTQFPGGTFSGLGFAASGDGGTATDYRAYNAPGAPLAGVYTAGGQNNTNSYYAGFGGVSAPAAQLGLFPQQTGTTAVGTLGMAWHKWDITRVGNIVTWEVDGLLLATVTNPNFGGSNIFLGQFDINAGSSTDPNARALLFGLVDNVSVTAVPEPGTMAALGLGAAFLARFRRKQK